MSPRAVYNINPPSSGYRVSKSFSRKNVPRINDVFFIVCTYFFSLHYNDDDDNNEGIIQYRINCAHNKKYYDVGGESE